MVVDDEATIRLMTRRFLEHADFTVIDVASGARACRQFELTQPDLILLDVDMPDMGGFEVCRWIRAQRSGTHVPIVMVTGREDPDSVKGAYDAGATDFIVKPIAWAVLAYRLHYILRASQTQNALRESHSQIRAIFEAMPDLLYTLNADGTIHAAAHDMAYTDVPGEEEDGTYERKLLLQIQLRHRIERMAPDCVREAIATDQPVEREISLRIRSEEKFFEIRFVRQSEEFVLAVVRDVTEQKIANQKIHQLAYFDTLTGLPNRQYFSNELQRAIDSAEREDKKFALLYIDLDHFKRINDTLGHTTGDALLKMVAGRLAGCVRDDDVVVVPPATEADPQSNVARLGGDEFTVLLHDTENVEDIERVAMRIIDTLKKPFKHKGHEFIVTPSLGIALYPDDGADIETLMKNADVGMYQAKQAGRSAYSFCTETTSMRSLERLELEMELRRALENDELTLNYQPKIDCATWRVIGAEALLRWHHEERGWISPGKFVPIAEDTGLIVPLGRWVINEVCRQICEWQRKGIDVPPIAVNLSSQQFWQDDVVSVVETALGTSGLAAEMLELELTEGVLMRDADETRDVLHALKSTGVSLAVDDFGTGYSSLAYLRKFPLDALKIDRSFVDDLPADDAAAICNAIISMSKSLNLRVVAEGVENREQLKFLTEKGCDEIQGFLFSRPVMPDELAMMLRTKRQFISLVAAG
jgi:diguanylate cyclase (GGDEF)-like protein